MEVINNVLSDFKQWKNLDGILTKDDSSSKAVDTAFSDGQQNDLFCIEDNSWWFQYRRYIILLMAEKYFTKNNLTVDVGGGGGFVIKEMERLGYQSALIEPSIQACKNAQKRRVGRVIHGALCEEDIMDSSISQILLLDVLEHISDADSFLKLLYKKVRCTIIITVPAFQCLWSSEDVAAGHFRRYKIKELHDAVEAAGFVVIRESYFFSFLFFPVLLGRVLAERIGLIKKVAHRSDDERKKIMDLQFVRQPFIIKVTLKIFESIEMYFLKRKKVLFGSSIIMVLKKL